MHFWGRKTIQPHVPGFTAQTLAA